MLRPASILSSNSLKTRQIALLVFTHTKNRLQAMLKLELTYQSGKANEELRMMRIEKQRLVDEINERNKDSFFVRMTTDRKGAPSKILLHDIQAEKR